MCYRCGKERGELAQSSSHLLSRLPWPFLLFEVDQKGGIDALDLSRFRKLRSWVAPLAILGRTRCTLRRHAAASVEVSSATTSAGFIMRAED